MTTTEFCDLVAGGVLVAVPERLESAGRRGIPQVVSLGALDMVNFGPLDTVPGAVPRPEPLRPQPDDHADADDAGGVPRDRADHRREAERRTGPTVLFVPLRGVSAIATEGQVFYDPAADEALFETIRAIVDAVEGRAARGRRGRQRSRLRARDGEPAARADRGGVVTRAEALARLRAQIAAGSPIIGAGAGTGLSAKLAEAGGADLIIIYNSGRYRMGGRGSLAGLMPYGDANEIVVDMAREVLPVVKETPVLAGVCGTDPFRLMPVFIAELKRIGFSGIQNFPTVGLIDGTFRVNLEETGMGYGLEVDAIRIAHELDLLTAPYVFTDDDATAMAEAGADVLVPHMGLTTGGSIGADTAKTLDDCVPLIQGDARRREARQPRRDRPLPRRPDRRAGRRRLHPRAHRGRRRLLRRLVDGAAADGGCDDREHAAVQVDPRERGLDGRSIQAGQTRSTATSRTGVCSRRSAARATGSRESSRSRRRSCPASATTSTGIPGQEEVIYVSRGHDRAVARAGEADARPGDSVVIPASCRPCDLQRRHRGGEDPRDPLARGRRRRLRLEDVAGDEPWASLR